MAWLSKIPPMMSALAFGYGVGTAAPEAAIDDVRGALAPRTGVTTPGATLPSGVALPPGVVLPPGAVPYWAPYPPPQLYGYGPPSQGAAPARPGPLAGQPEP